MVTIRRWTGREARALREATRMSVREFAAHLGVSDRTVSKWEAGGVTPRPDMQAALDTALQRCAQDVHIRFELLVGSPRSAVGPVPEPTGPVLVRHPNDGKIMVLVAAGVFPSGPMDESIWLPAYYIDVYPTTNADYANFVAATDHPAPLHWVDGRIPEGVGNHPVVHVTHHDAVAYADWAGKRLPTAEEWEKAARGTHGRTYPWGDQPTPAKCNVRESGPGSTTRVDCYQSGTSIYGVHDLCGNVWEWCDTETEPGRYALKGSAFTSPFSRATPAAFNDAAATMSDDDTGFRCAAPRESVEQVLAPH